MSVDAEVILSPIPWFRGLGFRRKVTPPDAPSVRQLIRLPPGLDDRRGAGGAMSATLMRPSAMCPRSRTSSTSAVGAVAIDLQPVPATAPDRMPQGEDDVAGLFHVVQLRREGRAYLAHRPRLAHQASSSPTRVTLASAASRCTGSTIPGRPAWSQRGSPCGASQVRRGAESVDDAPLGQLDFLYMQAGTSSATSPSTRASWAPRWWGP